MRRLRGLTGAFALVLSCALAVPLGAAPRASADTQLCDQYGTTTVQNGAYVVQNNEWNDTTQQCIDVTNDGFGITTADHDKPTSGPPAAYPSIYAGCHYGTCSSGSGLPVQVSSMGQITSSVAITTAAGDWDSSYDIWFDPTPNPPGQNTGAELMIWVNHQGPPQPFGSQLGTVSIDGSTWQVWEGNQGWNTISYVDTTPATSANLSISDFVNDSVSRGYIQTAWYMTSVQYGFEPWVGGQGLGVDSFSLSTVS